MHPSEPSTIDQPAVSPQTAGTLQSDQATVRRPAPVFRIGRAGSSTLDPVRDIHKLLRARLRVVSLLAAVALTQYLVTGLLTPPSVLSAGLDATLEARPWLLFELLLDLLTAVLGAILWSRRGFSVLQLR